MPPTSRGPDGKLTRRDLHARAIPGGGTGPNSAYKFRTADGYAEGLEAQEAGSGTSIFDPVLCELLIRWFCPPGGLVLDPFAGGSVRGIVAAKLGRQYVGIELRPEQVKANEEQLAAIAPGAPVRWITGDAQQLDELVPEGLEADLILSCPPYGDLERYSDDERDLSTMSPSDFLAAYRRIVAAACARLKQDRFAAFVVGDYRDKKSGVFRGFPWRTCEAFELAGLGLYNEAVLVTAVGSLPIRVPKIFSSSRKLGKTHQNVLVFLNGDAKAAVAACGEVDVSGGPEEQQQ